MVADDIRGTVEAAYGPLPSEGIMTTSKSKGQGRNKVSLWDSCLRFMEAAKTAFRKETGCEPPEDRWAVQLVRRWCSGPRVMGPKAYLGEWKMLVKLDRDGEPASRLGHAPIEFADYDFCSEQLPASDWDELSTVDYELSSREALT